MLNNVWKAHGYAIAMEGYTRQWSDHPQLIYVHQTPGKTQWIERTFRHDCVMLVLSGSGEVSGPGGSASMRAPFGFLARAGNNYQYGPHQTWDEYGFVFAHHPAPAFLASFPDLPWSISAPQRIERQLITMSELCHQPAQPGVADQIDLLAHFTSVLSWKGPSLDHLDPARQKLFHAQNWIREHFSEIETLDAIPMRFGLSRATFRRLWLSEFPSSPWQYIVNLRLQQARRLLQDHPELRIGEIADAVGFKDQRHFATAYRRHFGETPSAARR